MSHPDDELLSALLDGEAPPDDAAHVDGCNACEMRLEQLRHASALVGAAVSLPPGHLREASLSAAMRAADQPLRVAAVTSLGRRIPNRSSTRAATRRRGGGLSAAAALLVAVAVGGLAISQLGGSPEREDRQADNSSLAQGFDSPTAGAGGGTAADARTESAASMPASTDLGPVDDISEVSRRSTSDLAARDDAEAGPMSRESLVCPPAAAGEPVLWQATLTYRGTPAVATVRASSSTTRVSEIRSQADCALLATQAFEPTAPR